MSRVSRAADGKAGDNFSPAVSSDGLHLAFTFKESADDIVAFGPARPGTVALRMSAPPRPRFVSPPYGAARSPAWAVEAMEVPANGRSYLRDQR